LFFLPLWYVLILFKELFLVCQPKEEVGSAGEQPTSNKVDAVTIKEELIVWSAPLSFIG
jgi:hypothetical protein